MECMYVKANIYTVVFNCVCLITMECMYIVVFYNNAVNDKLSLSISSTHTIAIEGERMETIL